MHYRSHEWNKSSHRTIYALIFQRVGSGLISVLRRLATTTGYVPHSFLRSMAKRYLGIRRVGGQKIGNQKVLQDGG